MLKSLSTSNPQKVVDNQENIDRNITPVKEVKPDKINDNKKAKTISVEAPNVNDSNISSLAIDEINKLRKEIQELSMSVKEIKRHHDSPETIKMPRSKTKKGLNNLIKHVDSDEERDSESPDKRLSSDSDEEYQRVTKHAKQKRKTSKTRFGTFKSKNKINDKHKVMKAHRENETDFENEFMRSKHPPKNENISNKYENQSEDLANSRLRYNKLAEKALDEMGQITSEDEEMMIMKKRQHMINSVKKDQPRNSKRLENMLKNAAINSEDSIEMTPSSLKGSRVIPEQHPYNYPQSFNYGHQMPPAQYNPNNFYPEATFSPHMQPHPMSYNPHMNQSYGYSQMNHSYHEGMAQYPHAAFHQNPQSYQPMQNMHQASHETPVKNAYNKGLPFVGKF